MTPEWQKSILTIALYAAFADRNKHEREREEIRRIADSLAKGAGASDLARLYQGVLLERVRLEAVVAALIEPGQRQLAYEMAVCVCDADGRHSETERHFVAELGKLLQLDPDLPGAFESEADAIVDLTEAAAPTAAMGSLSVAPSLVAATLSEVPEAETDKSILNYALITNALELLPQSWASMGIIPLQIKIVYRIGKAHGAELDQGHIKEFIATAGVGLTSQDLEQYGRKLLGGLLGKAAGRNFGKLGGAATGMAFTLATNYALGQLSKRYYAGGRAMNTAVLRETFQNLLGPAKQMQTQYMPQIRQRTSTLDMGQVMAMVRGT